MTQLSDLNLLFIMADQLRADTLEGALAAHVPTPHLDSLARRGLVLTRHHTVATPCGPARASLLTGRYAHDHGAQGNGVPLRPGLSNLALELRKLGREPLLFGYTDTQPDPTRLHPNDPAHLSYTGPMEGFTEVVEMREESWRWLSFLRAEGLKVPDAGAPGAGLLYEPKGGVFGGPALYSARQSDTAFLTDETIKALDIRKRTPWTAFVTYIRPHPPFVAPAPYHDMIDPDGLPAPLRTDSDHPLLVAERASRSNGGMFWGFDGNLERLTPQIIAKVRATYLGLVAELDANIGRLFDWLRASGQMERTLIVFTGDHGEQLGDFGFWGKGLPFPQASHIPFILAGPDQPAGRVEDVTESMQVMPALLRLLGAGQTPDFTREGSALVELGVTLPSGPALCQVRHDRSSRVADFDGAAPPLEMAPEDGTPL